jgi:hypothetical protein
VTLPADALVAVAINCTGCKIVRYDEWQLGERGEYATRTARSSLVPLVEVMAVVDHQIGIGNRCRRSAKFAAQFAAVYIDDVTALTILIARTVIALVASALCEQAFVRACGGCSRRGILDANSFRSRGYRSILDDVAIGALLVAIAGALRLVVKEKAHQDKYKRYDT